MGGSSDVSVKARNEGVEEIQKESYKKGGLAVQDGMVNGDRFFNDFLFFNAMYMHRFKRAQSKRILPESKGSSSLIRRSSRERFIQALVAPSAACDFSCKYLDVDDDEDDERDDPVEPDEVRGAVLDDAIVELNG